MHQPKAAGSVHLHQRVIRHTPKRPSAADIARAWSQAQCHALPEAVSGLAHDATAYERFTRVYRELCARPRRARRRLQRALGTTLAGVALMIALGHAPSAEAATITVNENCAVRGGGTCSLIDAINAANSDSAVGGCPPGAGADTIVLSCPAPANTYDLTTADNAPTNYSANGLPIITSPVTIAGNGATIRRVSNPGRGGDNLFRFFEVAASGDLTLNDTTLTNGYAADGGAIWTKEGGSLTLNRSTVTANRACYGQIRSGTASSLTITSSTVAGNDLDCGKTGGGILFFGDTMTLHNSTVSGNVNDRAGGIYAIGTVNISHSTITGNVARSRAGGLQIGYGSVATITHSLIAGNVSPSNGTDVLNNFDYATVMSTHNLFGQNGITTAQAVDGFIPDATDILATSDGNVPTALTAILDPLANNGGPTPTHALDAGSPAVDGGLANQPCPLATDQRGFSRPQGSACDIGAFELEAIDADGDGVPDGDDLCPGTGGGNSVDANGCADAQVDGDGDGFCNPGAPSGGPSVCTGTDNCPVEPNPSQADNDNDQVGDLCDDDDDNDGISDGIDNCPLTANTDQANFDGDGQGDACDDDDDNDTVLDNADNCPLTPNTDQVNSDGDSEGDACDADDDNDGVLDGADNCPLTANPGQQDNDADNIGDVCDGDDDNDTVPDGADNCPLTANPGQEDNDADNIGDVCDDDDDNDGVFDGADNCPLTANAGQEDNDADNIGDICDDDDDNDNVLDGADNCPLVANPGQEDNDSDNAGDVCDDDDDNDGVLDGADNCPLTANAGQEDNDSDNIGDICDADDDNDGVLDGADNCPLDANTDQGNNDGDAEGDVCDADDDNDTVLDVNDNCPLTANADQVNTDGDSQGDACDPDDDNDSVLDEADFCPATVIPEVMSRTVDLGTNRWVLLDQNIVFDTTFPQGMGPQNRFYTTPITGGCSCEQIVAETGAPQSNLRHGCTNNLMKTWSDFVNQ